MSNRTRYYRAATTSLVGPHFGRKMAEPYLPGTTHEVPLVNEDTTVSCGVGLYYTSHRRVAARWASVVMSVRVLGKQVRSDAQVRPAGVPAGVDASVYRKYRTDRMEILDVVGVVGYAPWGGTPESQVAAEGVLDELNRTLKGRESGLQYRLTGVSLERLRQDSYQLWEVAKVEKPKHHRYRIEIAVEGPLSGKQYQQMVWDTLPKELYEQGVGGGITAVEVTEQEA